MRGLRWLDARLRWLFAWLQLAGWRWLFVSKPDGTDFVCFESSAREIALGGGRGPTAEAGLPYRKDAPWEVRAVPPLTQTAVEARADLCVVLC